MKNLIENEGCSLKVGISDKKKEIYIPHTSRFLNTLVLGNKGTGKSSLMLKEFAYQTIADRNVGGTFVVSSKDLSYELYILAKHYKRRVVFINPSVSNDAEVLLKQKNTTVRDISSKYNFEKYIFNNYIVIIDSENVANGSAGVKFTSLLLENLKNAMYKSDITCSRPHFLYVDDAFYYMDYLQDIIYYGDEYNLATTLFFQNRNQFKNRNKDYTSFIDSNIGNIILTNNLTINDAKFYGEILDVNLAVCSKGKGKFFYEFKSKDGARFSGNGEIKESSEIEDIIYEELYPVKRALKRKKLKELEKNNSSESSENVSKVKKTEPKEDVVVKNNSTVTNNELRNEDSNINKQESSTSYFEDEFADFKRERDCYIEEDIEVIEDNEMEEESLDNNFDNSSFDDGKIELTLDWDDDDF